MPPHGDAVAPSLVLEDGVLLAGKYRLARPAGFGGMAQLWVATNQATGAEVCVKVLVPQTMDDEPVLRFRREASAAARLSHRAIVRVFDLLELAADGGLAKGRPVVALGIVMELLHGESLGDFLMKRGKLPVSEALDIMLPFLSALAHAHRAGVVHRDIKPDNVFLAHDPDGKVMPKVLDFGVSKIIGASQLTSDGVLLGTPSFMSPEQAKGASKVDARSDVFSAGIVFYMMLSGHNPFDNDSLHSVVSAILVKEPAKLDDVPLPIWEVLEKALVKDPAARWADATELAIALRTAAGRQVVTESGSFRASVASFADLMPADAAPSAPAAAPSSPARSPTGEPAAASRASAGAVPPPKTSSAADELGALPPGRSRWPLVALAIAALMGVASALTWTVASRSAATADGDRAPSRSESQAVQATSAALPVASLTAASPATSAAGVAGPIASAPPTPRAQAATSRPAEPPPRSPQVRPSAAASTGDRGRGAREPSIARDPGF